MLVLAVVLAATRAGAPFVITDDEDRWQLELPDGWTAVDPPQPATGRALAAYAARGRRLVVARVRGNTDGAYDGRPGFFVGLEDGVARETPGFVRLAGGAKKLGKKRKLPAYDVWYRAGREVFGIRFVFLRGYSVMATLEIPGARAVPRDARRLLESFGPAP